ncbi:MAG: DUF4019 domain-containing protein, partial [Candidatus Omnitrophica bacterium]|nr:DUF4019 domain-containing protein [Candidatus Omnitrophota bacterium]
DGVSLAGAVWSEGKQNFVYFDKWKVLSHNQLAALASARDYFNGAGTIIPFLFVPIGSDLLDLSKGVKREDDEIIDSDECYVITNSDMKYWISQKSFLIKKRQQVLRFEQIPLEISQDNAIQQMEYRGRPVTNETIRQYQEEYKAQCKLLSTMETVITEIHRNIIINQPIDFKPYISKYANVELTEPVKEKRKPRVISDVGKRSGEFSPEELASQVALEWLKLIDNGDYPESWEKTAEYFKAAIDKEQWNKSLLKERALLGKVISRKIKSKEYEFLKDMFYGEYIIIEFDTSFENKANVIEVTMLMLNENGSWQVCGYYIK